MSLYLSAPFAMAVVGSIGRWLLGRRKKQSARDNGPADYEGSLVSGSSIADFGALHVIRTS